MVTAKMIMIIMIPELPPTYDTSVCIYPYSAHAPLPLSSMAARQDNVTIDLHSLVGGVARRVRVYK